MFNRVYRGQISQGVLFLVPSALVMWRKMSRILVFGSSEFCSRIWTYWVKCKLRCFFNGRPLSSRRVKESVLMLKSASKRELSSVDRGVRAILYSFMNYLFDFSTSYFICSLSSTSTSTSVCLLFSSSRTDNCLKLSEGLVHFSRRKRNNFQVVRIWAAMWKDQRRL
jgi:hypothetical protein